MALVLAICVWPPAPLVHTLIASCSSRRWSYIASAPGAMQLAFEFLRMPDKLIKLGSRYSSGCFQIHRFKL